MNHLPIHPDTDSSRRAWLPCPNCNHGHDCPQCKNNHNCQTHWQYLLKNEGTRFTAMPNLRPLVDGRLKHRHVDANASWRQSLLGAMHATSW